METIDLFGNTVKLPEPGVMPGRNKTGSYINNPLIPLYGQTEGEKCKKCIHLVAKHFGKVYYKCALRNNVHKTSTKSDHKVNWPACGKFEKESI